ncbi:Acetylornithine/succinyldiaminopimelate aminotransferase [Caldalkalibacillus thermarum TA2.A1]|uniref:Acetylornithine aminotransferase n=1 Tax=Caldalkalibacillus thermarum (strain TA2.A1) TaxID=986075 RepID=F5L4S4_CALTT|nr:acetylornithine transaminase [Caldalkalibacillus thermarum]EGL83673.1 Acetylornithine/succinyldiaminopimelate aminotransferase [Caldalkalibacillus thermarum TA2.A1]
MVKPGHTAQTATERVQEGQHPLMQVYQRFPLRIVKGEGSYVWDEQGERYLDFTSGLAVCNLGHVPPAVKQAVQTQLERLWHCSNLFHIPVQEQLAQLLVENSCADQVFFCNSGAEANEAAIKLARKYAKQVKKTEAYKIVTFTQSFHGRTLATLTATGQKKVQQDFHPLPPGFRYLPYNDMDALQEAAGEQTCAVLLELVQGEGGVIPAEPEWVAALDRLCKKHGLLLMVDEVQTGMGRTGTLFAYEQYGIEPDVITLAKGLGSGFPIGALLAKAHVAQAFTAGSHGSTFGGNPLAASAGLATLNEMLHPSFLPRVQELAQYLSNGLKALAESKPTIKEVRGKGLLQGILVGEGQAKAVVDAARDKKVLLLVAGPDVVRILPPLTTSKTEIDELLNVLEACC